MSSTQSLSGFISPRCCASCNCASMPCFQVPTVARISVSTSSS
ncbi:Uncharacterised protein [Vibrio cholerae]|nr:Uncharacterised protein [Vibrio cholerae]